MIKQKCNRKINLICFLAAFFLAVAGLFIMSTPPAYAAPEELTITAFDLSEESKFFIDSGERVAAGDGYIVVSAQAQDGGVSLSYFDGAMQYDYCIEQSMGIAADYGLHTYGGYIYLYYNQSVLSISIEDIISGTAQPSLHSIDHEIILSGWAAMSEDALFVVEGLPTLGKFALHRYLLNAGEMGIDIQYDIQFTLPGNYMQSYINFIAAIDNGGVLLVEKDNIISYIDFSAQQVTQIFTLDGAKIDKISAEGGAAALVYNAGQKLISIGIDKDNDGGVSAQVLAALEFSSQSSTEHSLARQSIFAATDITVREGRVFILDAGYQRVVGFDVSTLVYNNYFAGAHYYDNGLKSPSNVSYNNMHSLIVISDTGNGRVVVTEADGTSFQFNINGPTAAAVDNDKNIYAVSSGKLYIAHAPADGGYPSEGFILVPGLSDVKTLKVSGGGDVYALSDNTLYSCRKSGAQALIGELQGDVISFSPNNRTGGFYVYWRQDGGNYLSVYDKQYDLSMQKTLLDDEMSEATDIFVDFSGKVYLLGLGEHIRFMLIDAEDIKDDEDLQISKILHIDMGYMPTFGDDIAAFAVSGDGDLYLNYGKTHAVYVLKRSQIDIITENILPKLDYPIDPLQADDYTQFEYVSISGYPSTLFYPFIVSVDSPQKYQHSVKKQFLYDNVVQISDTDGYFLSLGSIGGYRLIIYNGEPGFILSDNVAAQPAVLAAQAEDAKLLYSANVYMQPAFAHQGNVLQTLPAGTVLQVIGKSVKDCDGLDYYLVQFASDGVQFVGFINRDTVMPLISPPQKPYITGNVAEGGTVLYLDAQNGAEVIAEVAGGTALRIYSYTGDYSHVEFVLGSKSYTGYILTSDIAKDMSAQRQQLGLILSGAAIVAGIFFAVLRRKLF